MIGGRATENEKKIKVFGSGNNIILEKMVMLFCLSREFIECDSRDETTKWGPHS